MAENRALELNGGDDEDEALRIAIAMSLGQDLTQAEQDAIDLTQDESPPTLSASTLSPIPDAQPGQEDARPAPPVSGPSSSWAFGVDRKKMEEDRLARLKKRKAQELGETEASEQSQRQKRTYETAPSPPSVLSAAPSIPASRALPIVVREGVAPIPTSNPAAAKSNHRSSLAFPRGVVKKTWAYGQPRLGDDIKIEEVLQKDRLELAVLSSFQWDEDWLMSKIDIRRTKMVLIAFASNEAQREEMRSNVPRDKIRFCFPPMSGPGAMHSKLQLLKYSDYLRIVIPTGNLVSYDWGETGTLENMVFIIDLPKIEDAAKREANNIGAFGEDLCCFLSAQGLDASLVKSLEAYDFSETQRYAFVHSIAGSHLADDAWKKTGYCGLGRAVNTLGLGSTGPVQIDFVCSSVGSVNESLVRALHNACQGDSGLKEYELRGAKPKAKGMSGAAGDWHKIQECFRVYFPSRETVLSSKGGKDGAGTISFQSRWWQSSTFPHKILRDCKSIRPGLLMHSKVLYVRPRDGDEHGARAFSYVGSANLSESAWGRLSQDRITKKPKLTCRNWECGVVMQVEQGHVKARLHPPSANDIKVTGCTENLVEVFQHSVPVPMQIPGVPFLPPSEEEGRGTRTPWFFQG